MEVLRTLIPALVGALLLDRLGVPAGALIGAMIGAAAVNFFGFEAAATPLWLRFAALAVIGWEIGRSITPDRLDAIRGALLPMVAVVIGLLVSGAAIAFVLTRFGIDAPTAFLAASPGGVSQMGAISADVGADAALVVTVHLMRVITVVMTAPFIVRLLDR
jgi:membrane AbrB-like protein